jgi:hypothetical protein
MSPEVQQRIQVLRNQKGIQSPVETFRDGFSNLKWYDLIRGKSFEVRSLKKPVHA